MVYVCLIIFPEIFHKSGIKKNTPTLQSQSTHVVTMSITRTSSTSSARKAAHPYHIVPRVLNMDDDGKDEVDDCFVPSTPSPRPHRRRNTTPHPRKKTSLQAAMNHCGIPWPPAAGVSINHELLRDTPLAATTVSTIVDFLDPISRELTIHPERSEMLLRSPWHYAITYSDEPIFRQFCESWTPLPHRMPRGRKAGTGFRNRLERDMTRVHGYREIHYSRWEIADAIFHMLPACSDRFFLLVEGFGVIIPNADYLKEHILWSSDLRQQELLSSFFDQLKIVEAAKLVANPRADPTYYHSLL